MERLTGNQLGYGKKVDCRYDLTGNQLGCGKKVDCRYDLTNFQPSVSEDQVGLR